MNDTQKEHEHQQGRSEGLLPAETDDDDNDSFDVAEEMNLDQQSDRVRHLGNLPEGEEGEQEAAAIAPTLGRSPADKP